MGKGGRRGQKLEAPFPILVLSESYRRFNGYRSGWRCCCIQWIFVVPGDGFGCRAYCGGVDLFYFVSLRVRVAGAEAGWSVMPEEQTEDLEFERAELIEF